MIHSPSGTFDQEAIGLLQRALNALNRGGPDHRPLTIDRRIGGPTLAALSDFLVTRGAAGETMLLKAVATLRGDRIG